MICFKVDNMKDNKGLDHDINRFQLSTRLYFNRIRWNRTAGFKLFTAREVYFLFLFGVTFNLLLCWLLKPYSCYNFSTARIQWFPTDHLRPTLIQLRKKWIFLVLCNLPRVYIRHSLISCKQTLGHRTDNFHSQTLLNCTKISGQKACLWSWACFFTFTSNLEQRKKDDSKAKML